MMRVYALYFRNNWVLAIVALEAVATIAIGCVSTFLLCDQDAHMSIPVVGSHKTPRSWRHRHTEPTEEVSFPFPRNV